MNKKQLSYLNTLANDPQSSNDLVSVSMKLAALPRWIAIAILMSLAI